MGRAGGAALKVVAPEVALASKAAGRGRRPAANDPRRTAPGSKAAQQREGIEAIKASRPPEPEPAPTTADVPPPTSPGGGPSLPAMPAAASTGSGFLLGVIAWAGALAYLKGGLPGLKKFANAKLFNKV